MPVRQVEDYMDRYDSLIMQLIGIFIPFILSLQLVCWIKGTMILKEAGTKR
jgi:hypothetical protein